jgi:uncharacterized protein
MPNALSFAKSPYLRQHAANPVQWLPWGDEAFERAQREGKPILLSIGYAACHWCHVMARESFNDVETAALMNEHFVNIKVDREERPDVDAAYLRALQAMGKRAGWPLTMFLTTAGKPFWGGTYFPPVQRGNQPAFRDVLIHVSESYQSEPDTAEARAAAVLDALETHLRGCGEPTELRPNQVLAVAEELLGNMDKENGGLIGAPKFPYPALLRFLWNTGCRKNKTQMQEAVVLSLNRMMKGGIFDHLGGGFSRYATDARWLTPHFEKMLYDNALLVHLLTDVSRVRQQDAYEDVVRRIVTWLRQDMTLASGAFACSLDAESGEEEGGFYLWSEREIDQLLGSDAVTFKRAYGVTAQGNFKNRDSNILNRLSDHLSVHEEEDVLARCRATLLNARRQRRPPRRDEKVLADWNGMAIAALAKASIVFHEPQWLEGSIRAFEFVISKMVKDGLLYHSWCDGELSNASVLDDYANMAFAAVTLYEVTGSPDYLQQCTDWTEAIARLFSNPERGGFYYTPDNAISPIARIYGGHDTATPSGNGVIAHVLARLYYLTGNEQYRQQARSIILAFANDLKRDSYQLSTLLDASSFMFAAVQIVVFGATDNVVTRALFEAAHRHRGPDNVVMLMPPGITLPSEHPASGKGAPGGMPVAYVCSRNICSAPAFDVAALQQTIDAVISVDRD